jgi:hypothetical protein
MYGRQDIQRMGVYLLQKKLIIRMLIFLYLKADGKLHPETGNQISWSVLVHFNQLPSEIIVIAKSNFNKL